MIQAASQPNAAQGQCGNESGRGSHNDRPLLVDDFEKRLHATTVDAGSRAVRVPLTKRNPSGSFFKLTHYRPLTGDYPVDTTRPQVLVFWPQGMIMAKKSFLAEPPFK